MFGGRRAVLVSTASTIVFFVVLATVLYLSPGFDEVRQTFFDWHAMKESFFGTDISPSIWGAFLLNVKMFLIAEPLILILALVIAVVRQIPGPVFFPLRLVAIAYTDFFRGVPLILVVILFGYGLPGLQTAGLSNFGPTVYGVAALVLSYSAYVAEVYRAGIESIHPSQVAAARSLGLSRLQALRHVVVPQAVRRVIPPLLNDFISLQKDTALVGLLGSVEALKAAQIYSFQVFDYSSLLVAAFLFILITIPLARFTDRLVARSQQRRGTAQAR
jgi:polar amino acid transport system permease protein